ncbi:MAG: threonine dehydratase [bacterium]|nr:threonine dehydratase [Gammaproteobacteria bacterium]HIL95337.1 threonine dehydratase [Pseudomonadales bacterium]
MATVSLQQLKQRAEQVYQVISPTPQIQWPLLSRRAGCEVWLKHENHNPTGSFKVRGGLIYFSNLKKAQPGVEGVIAATRGNFGQSVAYAASRLGLASVVVVPEGNSPDKNRAMASLGAEVVTAGRDFDESVELAKQLAADRGLHLMPSFHKDLMLGVGSYALELFEALPNLDRVYVPIGLGSGICGTISARNALGLTTEIVGVVSENANAYQLSFTSGTVTSTDSANTLADGLAVRIPNAEALELILANVSRIVAVSEKEILQAIQTLFVDTHNVAEGAGAAATAAILKEHQINKGRRVASILSGGNIHKSLFIQALAE